jgi:hypothetical protein
VEIGVKMERILDKIDEWSCRIYDWQRTSPSRAAIVFCLHTGLLLGGVVILFALIVWVLGALVGS